MLQKSHARMTGRVMSSARVDLILPGHRVFADSSIFWPLASRKCSAFECFARASSCLPCLHNKAMIELPRSQRSVLASLPEACLHILATVLATFRIVLTETWEVSDDHGAGSALTVLLGWGVVATGPALAQHALPM